MSTFISKLQFKYYEKGEFIDEKPRNLKETLDLIRSYPWDQQRGVDVQPTCPSVTIRNEHGKYLKLGNYFGGKFALYMYDHEHHLYELHEPTLDEACQIIEQFFNNSIDKSIFDRHYFALGSKAHFDTRRFIYRFRFYYFYFLLIYLGFICTTFTIGIHADGGNTPKTAIWSVICVCVVIGTGLGIFLNHYIKHHGVYLEISSGRDDFYYGKTPDTVQEYNKKDIEKVTVVPQSKHNSGSSTIRFKDGSSIVLSPMVIDTYTFTNKFRDGMVEYRQPSFWWSRQNKD